MRMGPTAVGILLRRKWRRHFTIIVPHVTGVWLEATRDSHRDNFFGVRNNRLGDASRQFSAILFRSKASKRDRYMLQSDPWVM